MTDWLVVVIVVVCAIATTALNMSTNRNAMRTGWNKAESERIRAQIAEMKERR